MSAQERPSQRYIYCECYISQRGPSGSELERHRSGDTLLAIIDVTYILDAWEVVSVLCAT